MKIEYYSQTISKKNFAKIPKNSLTAGYSDFYMTLLGCRVYSHSVYTYNKVNLPNRRYPVIAPIENLNSNF